MFKKSIMTAAIISLASLSSVVNAQDGFDLDVTSAGAGAWVEVTMAGQPVSGATVTANTAIDEYVTNDHGRAYVHVRTSGSNSVTFTATDNEGHSASTKRFISRDHR